MKRSEVVKMIASKLERCHDRYGNLYNFDFVANELLEDIEEIGMLPPINHKLKPKNMDDHLHYHMWEFEDEEK